jgi:hypothetical protein
LKKLALPTFIFLLILSTGTLSLKAQEWSSEQKEVWELQEKMFKSYADGDLEGYMSCLHENYVSWSEGSPVPINKGDLKKWESSNLQSQRILNYTVKPVSIVVTDDVAVVNLYFWSRREATTVEGLFLTYSKITRFCKKEDGKWLILGNHQVKKTKK